MNQSDSNDENNISNLSEDNDVPINDISTINIPPKLTEYNKQQVLKTQKNVLDKCALYKLEYIGNINELKNSKCKITYKCLVCGNTKKVFTKDIKKCKPCNDQENFAKLIQENFAKLIEYGEQTGSPPINNKDNEQSINKLAKYYKELQTDMIYLKKGEKRISISSLTDEMNIELSKIFGNTWYETISRKKNKWTEENQIEWLTFFIKDKNLQPDDWYNIKMDDIKKYEGLGLIDKYDNSIKKLLDKFKNIFYPEHIFYEWKFYNVHNWEVPYKEDQQYYKENTSKYELFKTKICSGSTLIMEEIPLFRRFMDYVMEQEHFETIYQLRDGTIKTHGGTGLISGYGFRNILELAYPEITIQEFRLPYVQLTSSYWTPDRIRDAFEYYREINNKSVQDLIMVTKTEIENTQGWWSLLSLGTILELLQTGYPEIDWDLLSVAKITWTIENRKIALKRLAEKEGWKDNSDYYKLTLELANQNGLNRFMLYYNNSPIQVLRDILPEYEWKEWNFSKSNKCWTKDGNMDMDMMRSYFDEFYQENNLKSLDDFAGFVVKDFRQGILIHFGYNLYKCMTAVYPEHTWEEADFQALNYSKISIKVWKELMSLNNLLMINHKLNGGEVKIGKYYVDGYHRSDSYENVITILSQLPSYCIVKKHDTSTNIIFQYQGTYWHAHPDYYDPSIIHGHKKITCGEIYKKTCDITEELYKTHHVVEIWDQDYMKSI